MTDQLRAEVEAVEELIKRRLPIDSTTRVKNLIQSLTSSFAVSEVAVRKSIEVMIAKEELEYRSRRMAIHRKR